jgi:hypothetical protein
MDEGTPGATPSAVSAPVAPAKAGWRGELRTLFSGIHLPGAVACVVASCALILSHYQGDIGFFGTYLSAGLTGIKAELYPFLYWLLASFVLFLPLPLVAAALTPGIRLKDTGLGPGNWRFGLLATAVIAAAFLPIVFIASRTATFSEHYPLCGAARASVGAFLVYEACYAIYFVGWESLFRGYLLFSLEPSMGKMAVFATMMPFVVIHYGKPEPEVFGSVIAGLALGFLALRTRSFWYGALIHILAALSMDVFATWGKLDGR